MLRAISVNPLLSSFTERHLSTSVNVNNIKHRIVRYSGCLLCLKSCLVPEYIFLISILLPFNNHLLLTLVRLKGFVWLG